MKRFIYIFMVAFLAMSCGPTEKMRTTIETFMDYRPYIEEGFLISPDSYYGEYDGIGELQLTTYPAKKYFTVDNNNRRSDVQEYKAERISCDELLDEFVKMAKAKGADAVVRFKFLIRYSYNYNYVDQYDIEYNLSGFLIKRE